MKQAQAFMAGEGRAWLKRNIDKLTGENDPVLEAIDKYGLAPHDVLEVGCANGWRLKILEEKWGCNVFGIDPCIKTHWPNKLMKGTARKLPCPNSTFDTVIYGWCLYLADPDDYFKIAMEGDRVLADRGLIIVYDFHADYPYKTPYKHKEGLFSHHYDFAKLWLSHPAYSLYGRTIQGETSVTILQKNLETAFPVKK